MTKQEQWNLETANSLKRQQLEDAHNQLDLLGIPREHWIADDPKPVVYTVAGRLAILNQVLNESGDELKKNFEETLKKYKKDNKL